MQQLFKDAPDLLAEFKDFLPDIGIPPGGIPNGPPMPLPGSQQWTTPDPSPPIDKSKKVPQPFKRKKKAVEKEPTPAPPPKVAPSRVCVFIVDEVTLIFFFFRQRKQNIITNPTQNPQLSLQPILPRLPRNTWGPDKCHIRHPRLTTFKLKCLCRGRRSLQHLTSFFSLTEQGRRSKIVRCTKSS